MNEASMELSRHNQQAQYLRSELRFQAAQAVDNASERKQAAAMLQQCWGTIQQDEQYRSHYEDLRDAHTSASQDVSRPTRNETLLCEFEMAAQEYNAVIQSIERHCSRT